MPAAARRALPQPARRPPRRHGSHIRADARRSRAAAPARYPAARSRLHRSCAARCGSRGIRGSRCRLPRRPHAPAYRARTGQHGQHGHHPPRRLEGCPAAEPETEGRRRALALYGSLDAPEVDRRLYYIWTADGWLCVSAVVDLLSRRVMGWSMKSLRGRRSAGRKRALTVGLRSHELAKNAASCGCLFDPDGRVVIEVAVEHEVVGVTLKRKTPQAAKKPTALAARLPRTCHVGKGVPLCLVGAPPP
ncbi:hypothetical protein C7450_101887 [Chelatococcus asaccharovorans]|uniref:Integrase-like protein n=1 Tax=Chelatococcus asaccharovorans TaxID=28210 RepID=A0A2V3ULC6_9HYPH|nr:hypothetical protein C7450_101887 [Chelatococcus asaccharovorans]